MKWTYFHNKCHIFRRMKIGCINLPSIRQCAKACLLIFIFSNTATPQCRQRGRQSKVSFYLVQNNPFFLQPTAVKILQKFVSLLTFSLLALPKRKELLFPELLREAIGKLYIKPKHT